MNLNSFRLRTGLPAVVGALIVAVMTLSACASQGEWSGDGVRSAQNDPDCGVWEEYRAIIGDNSEKIRQEGDSTWVWIGGAESGPNAEWADFTGAPMPPGELQYGLGFDAIPSIDDPVFTRPDNPALLNLIPNSPYRTCERPRTNDEIMVIGYVAENGEARAYPTGLLDRHELVNDEAGEEYFTVGWCPLADLSSVHSREHAGEPIEFGVSGYVYKNTYFIYDRPTESLWYALDEEGWTAVSGPRQGDEIPFIESRAPMPLGEWREKHPDTVVLAGDASDVQPEQVSSAQ